MQHSIYNINLILQLLVSYVGLSNERKKKMIKEIKWKEKIREVMEAQRYNERAVAKLRRIGMNREQS